jgi:hypothetical protein
MGSGTILSARARINKVRTDHDVPSQTGSDVMSSFHEMGEHVQRFRSLV